MLNSRSLTSTLDRMMMLNPIDEALTSQWKTNGSRPWAPALDIAEKKDAYQVHLELPGVSASDLEITFEQNVLTVRGSKRSLFEGAQQADLRVYAAERVTGAFERSIRLPEFIDGEHIDATFNDGLLTITVPKAKAAHARRIEVK